MQMAESARCMKTRLVPKLHLATLLSGLDATASLGMYPSVHTPEQDEQFYRDTESIAFPKLDDRQLAMLEPLGRRRIVRQGEVVYRAGQRDFAMAVILTGELQVFDSRDGREQILAAPGPRDFVGDIAMLNGPPPLA